MAWALVCAFVGVSCDDSDEGGVTTKITLDPATFSLKVGESRTIDAVVEPNPGDLTIAWSSSDPTVATVEGGIVTAVGVGTAQITAEAAGARATSTVTVTAKEVTSVTLDETSLGMKIGEEKQLTATVEPADATDPTVTWSSSDEAVVTVDNGLVKAIGAGTATITAKAGDQVATCEVSVLAAPKVGDYFYSDGTWSDGGLISIDKDGLNAQWAAEKPAPIEGKTVIGIVFQTDPDRIADSEKANGYTNGYVMATKLAHGSDKQTTWYSNDYEFDCLGGSNLSKTCYGLVCGYSDTQTVLETYPGDAIAQCPAFDWTAGIGFGVEAPESTSGWFLPSMGQLWDLAANFGGQEVAEIMKEWQSQDLNILYGYAEENVSYNVIDKVNEVMAKVPADQKEEFAVPSHESYRKTCSVWSSTFNKGGEGGNLIRFGEESIELGAEFMDYDAFARPILAF